MNSRMKGTLGEQMAARYLREKGYLVCAANYSYGSGEIDIIAEKKKLMCFVEVKTRTQGGMYPPADGSARYRACRPQAVRFPYR